MKNTEIAAIFFEMADILEMKNVEWKPRAYRQAARAIGALPRDIGQVYKQGGIKLLKEIPGVGEGIAKKIEEYLKTGKVKHYEELKKGLSPHLDVLMKIPGMGSKKLKKLNQVLKISTVKQLEKAAKAHKIASIPGFGRKSEQDILENIALMKTSKGKMTLRAAAKAGNKLVAGLKRLKEVEKISVAGSLRRKKPLVRDIDILVSAKQPDKVINAFTKLKNIKKVLVKGPTKATIVLKSGIQADLRVLPAKSWGAGLFYFTGSKNYSIGIRKIAVKKGLKLNEYGLFDKKTGKMVAGRTEEEICRKLGVKYLKPELREK